LLIFLAGVFFYSFVKDLAIIDSFRILIKEMQFERGWARGTAFNDPLTVTYSMAGLILAGIGLLSVLWKKKKQLYPYVIWPFYLFLMILVFRMTDFSFLSPYQRNVYYLTISLPLLSALGLNWIINSLVSRFKRVNFKFIAVPILAIAIFFSFVSYWEPSTRSPYMKMITVDDYRDLVFLAEFPRARVLAYNPLAEAVGPVTGHKVIGVFSDRFGLRHALEFFYTDDCYFRDALINVYDIDYIISKKEIPCGYKLLVSERNYIYQVNLK
jgi:hypothetical protein